MERKIEVGDTVEEVGSNVRMKVESIDKVDGSVVCSWKRGPAVHRKKLPAAGVVLGTVSSAPPPVRGVPSAVRPSPQRPSAPARTLRFR